MKVAKTLMDLINSSHTCLVLTGAWTDIRGTNKCPNLIVYYYLEAAKNFNQLPYWNGVLKVI